MKKNLKMILALWATITMTFFLTGCRRSAEVTHTIDQLLPSSSYERISYQESYVTEGQRRVYQIEVQIVLQPELYMSAEKMDNGKYVPIAFPCKQLTIGFELIRGRGACPPRITKMEDDGLDFSWLLNGATGSPPHERIGYTLEELKAKYGSALQTR